MYLVTCFLCDQISSLTCNRHKYCSFRLFRAFNDKSCLFSQPFSAFSLDIDMFVCETDFISFELQWNSSCEVTPFASEKWPFKRGGLSSGVEIITFMFIYIVKRPLQRGWPFVRVASQKGFHCNTFLY